jgi:hypothetical protein
MHILPEEPSLEQAGRGLEKLVAQSLRQAPPGEAPLLAWPVACGSAVAERTHALSFADGVLRVEVADAGWKSELQALAPRYLSAINRYTTAPVYRIEFVVAYPPNARGAR